MKQIKPFFQKHKRIFQCALVCMLAFCIFASVWLTEIRGQGEKSLSWAINDQFHSFAAIEQQMSQSFRCNRDMLSLSFVLAPVDEETPPEGELELLVTRSGSDQVLARSVGDLRFILNGKDGYYTTLGFDQPVPFSYQEDFTDYTVTLIPHYKGEGRLAIGYEAGRHPSGISLEIDGERQNGMIALTAVQARIGGFLTLFYWIVAFLSIGLLGFAFWMFTSKTVPLHRLVFVLVLGLGILFNMVLPPYSAPDERFHINQSFSLASTFFDPHHTPARTDMSMTLHRPSDSNPLVQVDEPTVFTWQAISRELTSRNTDEWRKSVDEHSMQVEANYNLYWVSGMAVLLGFFLRLGFVPTLFLGRMANLLVFALFAMLAVKKTPVAKQVFALAALLPMTLHLAASYSRDSGILAISFLFVALVLDAAFGPREALGWKQLVPISLLGALLVPSKLVYFPMMALIFLIPSVRMGKRSLVIRMAMLTLCAVVFFMNSNATAQVSNIVSGTTQLPDGAHHKDPNAPDKDKDPEKTEEEQLLADSICYTPAYILNHPIQTFELCVRSVLHQGEHYIRTAVGGTLGYFNLRNDLTISTVWVMLLYLLAALAWLCPNGIHLPFSAQAACLGVGLACCALAVAGCVVWTPTYYTTIYGLQGRYFLPAVPLLLLARPKKLTLSKDCSRGLVFAMGLTDLCVLLNAFLGVVAR